MEISIQKEDYVNCFERRGGKNGKLEYRICKMEQTKQTVYQDGSTETEEAEVEGSGRWVSADELYDKRETGICHAAVGGNDGQRIPPDDESGMYFIWMQGIVFRIHCGYRCNLSDLPGFER